MSLDRLVLKGPIHVYRWTLKPFIGANCRHLPTCSEYALDAIALNGSWRGLWLTLARLCRCNPWGTAGFDPAPDIRHETHTWAPWHYGRWAMRPDPGSLTLERNKQEREELGHGDASA